MHFRFARAGQMLSFFFNLEGMLERGFRVRAARRRGKAFAFPEAPASREQGRAYMPGREPGESQIMHARA